MTFMREVVSEVKKITWPGRDELRKWTVAILVFVALVAVVIKFVGTGREPMALRQDEVNRLLGIEAPVSEESPKEEIPFLVGQVVEIIEGPFSDFSGSVEEVLPDKGKVRVSVSLFGRPTSVELDYLQLKAH